MELGVKQDDIFGWESHRSRHYLEIWRETELPIQKETFQSHQFRFVSGRLYRIERQDYFSLYDSWFVRFPFGEDLLSMADRLKQAKLPSDDVN